MRGQLSQLFPIVFSFYGLWAPLYFNHHYSLMALFIIISYVGIHQGNPIVRPIVALIHFYRAYKHLGGIMILDIPFGSASFTSFFLLETLIEDGWHIDVLLRLKDV
jgi:hypothetical protein